MHNVKQDTYILLGIKDSLESIKEQKRQGYNPGVRASLKDIASAEITDAMFNLDEVEEIEGRPGSYRFTGIVSEGLRIGEYYYGEECSVEGYVSANKDDVCAIHFSHIYRQPRSYVSPREKKNVFKANKELYTKWHHQQTFAVATV